MRDETLVNLDAAESSLWNRAIEHLRRSQRWQHGIKLMLILGGGSAAGLAQLPIDVPDWLKAVVGVSGVLMVLAGGMLLLMIEKDYFDLISEARDAVAHWRHTEMAYDALVEAKGDLQLTLKREQDLMVAFDTIIKFLETALARVGVEPDERFRIFLGGAAPRLVVPLNLGSAADWTISIFLKRTVDGVPRMCRVASYWKERSSELDDQRTWARGKGWTGAAWQAGEERPKSPYVIEPDTTTEDAKAQYDADDQEREDDYERFRSVAAIPFRVRGSSEVSGVVTATSSDIGTFGRLKGTAARRNFDTVRSFTLLVAAFAAGVEN